LGPQPSRNVPVEHGIFADHARKCGSSFLYREIEIDRPHKIHLIYSGWWFWQRVYINQTRVWSMISWAAIVREIEFHVPESEATPQTDGRIEIEFSTGLRIRRFRVWLDGEIVFDEIN
jgi:hypothetical protein